METSTAVEVRDLDITRGHVRAVSGVSLDISSGTITGLLGPSGSGKTTLMRAIVGSQRIGSGRVVVLGHPAGSAAVRGRVGYMSQAPSLYLDLTVLENLRYFAAVLREPNERVDALIDQVDLAHRAGALVRDLSGGETNRTSLAVALLSRPALLVLDEPTVGLDPILRQSLWQVFRGLADDGAAVLVSSHVMDEAARCDRLVLMREGSVLFDGTQEQLRVTAGVDDIERAFILLSEADRP